MSEPYDNRQEIEAALNKPALRQLINRMTRPRPGKSIDAHLRTIGLLKAEPLLSVPKRRKSLPGQIGLFD